MKLTKQGKIDYSLETSQDKFGTIINDQINGQLKENIHRIQCRPNHLHQSNLDVKFNKRQFKLNFFSLGNKESKKWFDSSSDGPMRWNCTYNSSSSLLLYYVSLVSFSSRILIWKRTYEAKMFSNSLLKTIQFSPATSLRGFHASRALLAANTIKVTSISSHFSLIWTTIDHCCYCRKVRHYRITRCSKMNRKTKWIRTSFSLARKEVGWKDRHETQRIIFRWCQ